MRPGGTTPDRPLRESTPLRRLAHITKRTASLERRFVTPPLRVGDGSTTVTNVTDIEFSGATVTDGGGGIAEVAITGAGSCGQWIYVGTPDQVGDTVDVYGTLISDLIAANPAPFNADPWIPFENEWENSLGSDAPVSFMLDGCMVVLRGGAVSGADGTSIYTLPEGFRPLYQTELVAPTGTPADWAAALVGADGTITYEQTD